MKSLMSSKNANIKKRTLILFNKPAPILELFPNSDSGSDLFSSTSVKNLLADLKDRGFFLHSWLQSPKEMALPVFRCEHLEVTDETLL